MREVLYVVRRRKCGHEKGFAVIGTVTARNRHQAQIKAWRLQWHQVCFDGFKWAMMEFPEITPHYRAHGAYSEIAVRDADRRAGRPADAYYGRRFMAALEQQIKEARRHGQAAELNWWQRSGMRESLNRY